MEKLKGIGSVLLVALVVGCAPMTPAAIEKRDSRMYEQMDREDRFKRDEKFCMRLNGRMAIERNGKAKRQQEVLGVPGRGDRWACVMSRI